jgi:hypothetical protein
VSQQHAQLLTARRLHIDRAIKSHPHHLCDAAGICCASPSDA